MSSPVIADPREPCLRSIDQLANLVGQVTPGQLAGPTKLPGWDTRTLISHIVQDINGIAAAGEAGPSDVPAGGVAGDGADDDWAAAVARGRVRAAAAWADDAKLAATYSMVWGESTGAMALRGLVMELATHTWDLAQVVDPAADLDLGLGAIALDAAREIAPGAARDEVGLLGPVQPVPAGAGVYDQLAGWLGRKV